MPELQKKKMMTAFFQWYSTAKSTQFQWHLARFYEFGAFSADWYAAYGYEIPEFSAPTLNFGEWLRKAHGLFQQVGDVLWTSLHSIR